MLKMSKTSLIVEPSKDFRGRRMRGLQTDTETFPVAFTPNQSGVFTIYLYGVIEHSSQFIEAIDALTQASEEDVVFINLSTPGGSLDATDTFIQAMRECKARVIVRATGGVHSAGSIILLTADEFILSENFNCLIHNGETGNGGKFSDMKAATAFTLQFMEGIMRNTYDGFLTPEEIEALIGGKDFWLGPEEFVERWQRRAALEGQETVDMVE